MTTASAALTEARRQIGPAGPHDQGSPGDRMPELGHLVGVIVRRDRNLQVLAGELGRADQALARCQRQLDGEKDIGERELLAVEVEALTAARDAVAARFPLASKLPRDLVRAFRAFASYWLGRREYDGEVQAAIALLGQPANLAQLQREAARG